MTMWLPLIVDLARVLSSNSTATVFNFVNYFCAHAAADANSTTGSIVAHSTIDDGDGSGPIFFKCGGVHHLFCC